MKNWKHWTLVAIIAAFGIIVTLMACDNNNGKTDPKCTCPNGTIHTDAPCNCNAVEFDCECTYVPPEQPQFREETISLEFTFFDTEEVFYSANVQGTLTASQWNGTPDKIKTTIIEAFDKTTNDLIKVRYYAFSVTGGVTIIVEKTTDYSYYKTLDDGSTLYLNIDMLDNLLEQSTSYGGTGSIYVPYITAAVIGMYNKDSRME